MRIECITQLQIVIYFCLQTQLDKSNLQIKLNISFILSLSLLLLHSLSFTSSLSLLF